MFYETISAFFEAEGDFVENLDFDSPLSEAPDWALDEVPC